MELFALPKFASPMFAIPKMQVSNSGLGLGLGIGLGLRLVTFCHWNSIFWNSELRNSELEPVRTSLTRSID